MNRIDGNNQRGFTATGGENTFDSIQGAAADTHALANLQKWMSVPLEMFFGYSADGVNLLILSDRKRTLAARVDSPALRSDGHLSAVGAAQATVTLAGTVTVAVGWRWADPVAALGLLPLVIREAREAFEGRAFSCDC